MIVTKCFAAILLMELFFAAKPFASCLPLAEMVKETKLLLTYPGWKDILDKVKTITTEGDFDDYDLAKLVKQNEDIKKENIIYLVNHIFLMFNCRYASKLFFLSIIINDLATVCGYFADLYEMPPFSTSPLNFFEELLLSAFKLISIDMSYVISALVYFDKLSAHKIASFGIRPIINKSFKRNYVLLFNYYEQEKTPDKIRGQLQATIGSLETFRDNLNEYLDQKCGVETGDPDLWINYLLKLNELQQKSNLRPLLLYLQRKIIEVSDSITENSFKDCGFLYYTDTKPCILRQPETSTQ